MDFEPACLRFQRVESGLDEGEGEVAAFIGSEGLFEIGRGVGQRHHGARDRIAAGVIHDAFERRRRGLRVDDRAKRQERRERQETE
jgi:hypothetical protein